MTDQLLFKKLKYLFAAIVLLFCTQSGKAATESPGIYKATEIVNFLNTNQQYQSRYWFNYWPLFNVYEMRKQLTEEEQYRMIYSFLEDNAALMEPHMMKGCADFFFSGTVDSKENNYSRIIAMYSGVFSLDAELGHAWMMYLLERSFWERLWGGNRLWSAFRKSCRNGDVTVEAALASISAGRKYSYEAGR
jgi:hypothetical protein